MQNTFFKDFHVHITTDKGLIEYNKLTVVLRWEIKKILSELPLGKWIMDYFL